MSAAKNAPVNKLTLGQARALVALQRNAIDELIGALIDVAPHTLGKNRDTPCWCYGNRKRRAPHQDWCVHARRSLAKVRFSVKS